MVCCGDIADMLCQVIYVAKCCGVSEAGELTYSDPAKVNALVQISDKFVEGSGRTDNNTSHEIYTVEEIDGQDLVWLPGEDPKERCDARMPKSVSKCYDPELGEISHYEVMV